MSTTFETSLKTIKTIIQNVLTLDISTYEIDALMVKKLAASDVGAEGSSQTHIPLTGDRRYFFPIFHNLHSSNNFPNAKRMYLTKVPLIISKEQITYSGLEGTLGSIDVDTFTTVVISRPDSPQVELGDSNDGTEWKFFKNSFKVDDFLIFLKIKSQRKYLVFLVKSDDSTGLPNVVETTNYVTARNARTLVDFDLNIISIEDTNYPLNQILYGPPGTGKTYNAINHALAIIKGYSLSDLIAKQKENPACRASVKAEFDTFVNGGQIQFVTFHQSYSYEEFIEGIKPFTNDSGDVTYRVEDGTFKKMCTTAKDNPEKKYVIIIDEINRGNISKIFGELITLIEDSKRMGATEALQVKLPYSGITEDSSTFCVPQNIYIIGTLNSADKSIALIDTALRRRFTFCEYTADFSLLASDIEGINLQQLLETLNNRIAFLLDKDHLLGHAYFMGVTTKNELCSAFRHKILPLLEEYFYGDYEKIQLVLGDNRAFGKQYTHKIIISTSTNQQRQLFGEEIEGFEDKRLYKWNVDLWKENYEAITPQFFIAIYNRDTQNG